MNWFKKHLNWTLVIGVVVLELPVGISLWFMNPDSPTSMSWLLGLLLPVVIAELALEIWYLHQKKRNYAYLLLNFIKPFYIPVGFLILLALDNKRTPTESPEDKVMI